jgi:predicted ribosomally synthesized peptide with nif11-like leader
MVSSVGDFYQKLAADQDLRKQLQVATAAAAEQAVMAVAASLGFTFTVDEWRSHVASQSEELSDEDLAKVSGGVGIGNALVTRASFVDQVGLITGAGLRAGTGL